jgi:putative solute:sodium symporter small subunit
VALSSAGRSPSTRTRDYWRAVLRRTLILLAVWLLVGPVAGILFVDRLNAVHVGGLPLGFWIAQQGAIYVFVVLIFLYAWLSQRADRAETADRSP